MNAPIYLDTKSILVSTPKGLKRLNVPFKVIVIITTDNLVEGDKVMVVLVGFSKEDHLLYLIKGEYYKYCLFVIIDPALNK